MIAEPVSDSDWPPRVRAPVATVALDDLLKEWLADESGEPERSWALLKAALNETRKELGQAPVCE